MHDGYNNYYKNSRKLKKQRKHRGGVSSEALMVIGYVVLAILLVILAS